MTGGRASHDVAGLMAGAFIALVTAAGWSSAALAQGAEQDTEQAAKQETPSAAAEGPAIDVAATEAAEIEWQEKISSIGVAEAV